MHNLNENRTIVLLVDHRVRDLDVSVLIAKRLEALGITCFLEPLEAYRAVIARYRPDMVIINQAFASHLVRWAGRLRDMGVAVGVLTNEGIIMNREGLKYQSGAHQKALQLDIAFAWNKLHGDALEEFLGPRGTNIHIIGVPRFDFYFDPYRAWFTEERGDSTLTKALLCTNAGLSDFYDKPKDLAYKFASQWSKYMEGYGDFWERVEEHAKARDRFVEYLQGLAETGQYDITLRPHPHESSDFYERAVAAMPKQLQSRIRIDRKSNITKLLLNHDVHIADECCTTGMEAWIARKPTVGLVTTRHPGMFLPEIAACQFNVDDPAKLPSAVAAALDGEVDSTLIEKRNALLEKVAATPDGHAAERLAEAVSGLIKDRPEPDWSHLGFQDHRRAAKLRFYSALGLAYHFDPFVYVKRIFGRRAHYNGRIDAYVKSIKPTDVRLAKDTLRAPDRRLRSTVDRLVRGGN